MPDRCFELTVPYSDPRELLGEILRHGPDVEVLEPAELVDAVREYLVEAAAQYEQRRFGSTRGQVSGSGTARRYAAPVTRWEVSPPRCPRCRLALIFIKGK